MQYVYISALSILHPQRSDRQAGIHILFLLMGLIPGQIEKEMEILGHHAPTISSRGPRLRSISSTMASLKMKTTWNFLHLNSLCTSYLLNKYIQVEPLLLKHPPISGTKYCRDIRYAIAKRGNPIIGILVQEIVTYSRRTELASINISPPQTICITCQFPKMQKTPF